MYRRLKNNELNQDLINISEKILNQYKNNQIGSEFHFQHNGEKYKAVFERHSNSPKGVSLFVEEGNKKQLSPQQQALHEAFDDYLQDKGIQANTLGEGLQILEKQLGKSISYALPNVSPSVVRGLIWQGDHINPNTSPEDIESALETLYKISKYKKGQAPMDAITVDQIENPPLATKQVLTQEDTKLETGEKEESQQIGMSSNVAPKGEAVEINDPDYYLYQNLK